MKQSRPVGAFFIAGSILLGFGAGTAAAEDQARSLSVGDPAPPLTIQAWLKGDPIPRFESGKIYVVEFGATWCPPCRKAIPHLTELSKQYAGKITVISVFAREHGTKEDPTDLRYIDKVRYQMASMGAKMDFNVAVDVPQQTTGDAWKINGVPHAYVVDGTARIAWSGSPFELESVMAKFAAGSFDEANAAREQEEIKAALASARKLRRAKEYPGALAIYDGVMARKPEFNYLHMVKYEVLSEYDEARADALLKWILAADIPGFDWDHFVSSTFSSRKNPNYELALATADRAVEKAETKLVAGFNLLNKALIYQSRSARQTDPTEARHDLIRAVETVQQALDLSKSTGDPRDAGVFENYLRSFQFKLWAGTDDAKANALLRSLLKSGRNDIEWYGFLTDALERQHKPDYKLLLTIADKTLAKADQDAAKAYPLSKKGDIYAAKGDTADALTAYQQALEAAKAGGDEDSIKRYEEKLLKFRQKVGKT